MNTINKYFLFIFLFTILTACQSVGIENNRWLFFDTKGIEKFSVTEKNNLNLFNAVWDKKREVKVKMMPSFEYELHITKDDSATKWLYSTDGYVMLKASDKNIIYKTELSELIEKL